jgi:DNA primase
MIAPETIAKVKERTDLVALIGETVKLTRRGRSFVGLCPFHKEKTPSFSVNPERGLFFCFGCKEAGGAVDFVMKTEGQSFPEAIRSLADRAGIEIVETVTEQERREANAAKRDKESLYAVNHAAATFFERSLRGAAAHPLAQYALSELARRELPFPAENDAVGEAARIGDTLQAFRIGYAPFGWDALVSYFRQQGISPVQAEKVGLVVPRSSGSGHYDRFRHRLMFAVSDVMGRVIAFSGRSLPDPSPDELARLRLSGPTTMPDAAPAKYMNSPESPIYTKGEHLFGLHQARQAIRQSGEAVLVEGNFDVVSLHARGFGNVVAPLGTAFTPTQAKLLKRFASRVIVLFDGDEAGKKAVWAADKVLRHEFPDTRVATLPSRMDPDDFTRKEGASALEALLTKRPRYLTGVLRGARGIHEFIIESYLDADQFSRATLEERQRRVRELEVYLADLARSRPETCLLAKTYADQIAARLLLWDRALDTSKDRVDLDRLRRSIEEATTGPAPELRAGQQTEPRHRARSRTQADDIPQHILGALLDFPALLSDPEVEEALALLDGDVALGVAALRRILAEHANLGPEELGHPEGGGPNRQHHPVEIGVYAAEFLAQIPRSIQAFAFGRLASPAFDGINDARTELLGNARKLSSLSLKRENAAEIELLHRVEAEGDADKENEILRAAVERSRRRHGLS